MRESSGVEVGERMLLWCTGGPSRCRAVTYPPPPEIHLDDGLYVLVDDSEIGQWRYDFIAE
jgi:hypothetical protein